MKSLFLALCYVGLLPLSASSQDIWTKSYKMDRAMPAGNYSGITSLGGDRYAIVSDKTEHDGFYEVEIRLDSASGKIRQIRNLGFRDAGQPNRDAEGIALLPAGTGRPEPTLLISGEADNRIVEYRLDGSPTGRSSAVLLPDGLPNSGIEGLCYDAATRTVWAIEENDGRDSARLLRLDTGLQLRDIHRYAIDPPTAKRKARWYAHGVSELCPTGDGRLFVLEREVYVPKRKIGAWTLCRLYVLQPSDMHKSMLHEWRTKLNLTARSWGNYEGMCLGPTLTDGRRVLLLVSDSQNRYAGYLHDWLKIIILPPLPTDSTHF